MVPALLARARKEGELVFRETAARLLELAKLNQATFRTVMANITPEQRLFTEEILRSVGIGAGVGNGDQNYQLEGKGAKNVPSIALRMDF
jgi:hypothetical protein